MPDIQSMNSVSNLYLPNVTVSCACEIKSTRRNRIAGMYCNEYSSMHTQ